MKKSPSLVQIQSRRNEIIAYNKYSISLHLFKCLSLGPRFLENLQWGRSFLLGRDRDMEIIIKKTLKENSDKY